MKKHWAGRIGSPIGRLVVVESPPLV